MRDDTRGRARSCAPITGRHASRARGWRRLSAALVATTLASVLQLAGAAPASADTCWVDSQGNVHCIWDGGTIRGGDDGGGGGGGGGGSHQPIPGDPDVPLPDTGGSHDALVALSFAVASMVDVKLGGNADCSNLITGLVPARGENARTVFQKVEIVRSATPHPTYPTAAGAADFNAGSQGTMTIYPPFDQYNGGDIQFFLPPNTTLKLSE